MSRRSPPAGTYDPLLTTPAFVGAAAKDVVVEDGPAELAKLFAGPEVLVHAEGHQPLPSARDGGKYQGAILAFLERSLL